MNIEALLGRIAGGSQSYDGMFAASTDPERITQTELAAVFAGMPTGAYLLALGKFLLDSVAERKFYEYIHMELLDLMTTNAWKEPRDSDLFSHFVVMALWEIYGSKGGSPCKACSGMGYVTGDGEDGLAEHTGRPLPKLCGKCKGLGKIQPTQRARASLLGISQPQWSRVWRERYEATKAQVERVIESHRLDMESHIIRKMRGGR